MAFVTLALDRQFSKLAPSLNLYLDFFFLPPHTKQLLKFSSLSFPSRSSSFRHLLSSPRIPSDLWASSHILNIVILNFKLVSVVKLTKRRTQFIRIKKLLKTYPSFFSSLKCVQKKCLQTSCCVKQKHPHENPSWKTSTCGGCTAKQGVHRDSSTK